MMQKKLMDALQCSFTGLLLLFTSTTSPSIVFEDREVHVFPCLVSFVTFLTQF